MSSIRLFESGVEMACLIILFNWFPLKASAFIVALWQTSYLIIPLVLEGFHVSGTENYVRFGFLKFFTESPLPNNRRSVHSPCDRLPVFLPPPPVAHRNQDPWCDQEGLKRQLFRGADMRSDAQGQHHGREPYG